MTAFDRRQILKGGAALGLASAAGLEGFARAWAQENQWKPEPGASLKLLRWKRFIPSEDEAFMRLVDAFTKATGVPVSVTSESFDDIQPKASVAANTGQGPDMVWGLYSFPPCFRRNASRSATSPITSARSTAAGCPRRRPTARSRASGSPSRWRSTAAISTTASRP